MADTVLTAHRERLGAGVRLITIDLDATDDPTHGQQELALFNGYYDTWCYLPLLATVTFDTESDERSTNSNPSMGSSRSRA